MQQLELFPKDDIVRYAMSLNLHELEALKSSRPEAYSMVRVIRNIVQKHNSQMRHLEKRFTYELSLIFGG